MADATLKYEVSVLVPEEEVETLQPALMAILQRAVKPFVEGSQVVNVTAIEEMNK